jgi:hypothetical protein
LKKEINTAENGSMQNDKGKKRKSWRSKPIMLKKAIKKLKIMLSWHLEQTLVRSEEGDWDYKMSLQIPTKITIKDKTHGAR